MERFDAKFRVHPIGDKLSYYIEQYFIRLKRLGLRSDLIRNDGCI